MKDVQKQLSRFIPDEKTPSEDRLVMLCDGIFAIAITLLVLDIGIHPINNSAPMVDAALEDLIQPGISYLVTFIVIAMYWRFHRTLMQVVQRLDNGFISLTFIFLAFIAFFPVVSRLVGDHGDVPSVIVVYTLSLSGCSVSALALWIYATWRHRLVSPELPQALINTRSISLLLNPLIYCASLLLLRFTPPDQPYLICFSWALIGYTQRGVKFIYTHWLEKPVHELLHREHSAHPEAPAASSSPESVPEAPAPEDAPQPQKDTSEQA